MEELDFDETLDTNHVALDYNAPIVIELFLDDDNEVIGEITYNP